MKISAAITLLFVLATDRALGFAPLPLRGIQKTTQLFAVRPDTALAVEEAMKVSAAFGIDSKEAAAAWDVVEEMDASDNSEATKGSLNDECEVENVSQECLDYGAFLDELTTLRDAMTPIGSKHDPMSLADTLGMIKLSAAESSKASGGAELAKALEAAKAATAEHGITSTEAKLAWETYEEIAASGTDNAVGVDLREECSVDAGEEACRAIEELDRVLPVLLAISSFDNRGQFGEGVDKQFEA